MLVKDRGVMFTTDSVVGIEKNIKTQTRRVMNPQPFGNGVWNAKLRDVVCFNDYLPPSAMMLQVGRGRNSYVTSDLEEGGGFEHRAPLGVVGQRWYVKETWGCPAADHPLCKDKDKRRPQAGDRLVYLANGADAWQWDNDRAKAGGFCWRSPMLMPRFAARIWLEITDVRVERVQDISAGDAWAEGVRPEGVATCPGDGTRDGPDPEGQTIRAYLALFDALNAPRGFPSSSNPHVYAYTFKRVDAPC